MASGVVGGEVLSLNRENRDETVGTVSQEVEMQKARLKNCSRDLTVRIMTNLVRNDSR